MSESSSGFHPNPGHRPAHSFHDNSPRSSAPPSGSPQTPSLSAAFLPVPQDSGQWSEATQSPFPPSREDFSLTLAPRGCASPCLSHGMHFPFSVCFCEVLHTCFISPSRLQIPPGQGSVWVSAWPQHTALSPGSALSHPGSSKSVWWKSMLRSRPPFPQLGAASLPRIPALVAGEWCVHVCVAGVQGWVCVNRVGVVWRLCECEVCGGVSWCVFIGSGGMRMQCVGVALYVRCR